MPKVELANLYSCQGAFDVKRYGDTCILEENVDYDNTILDLLAEGFTIKTELVREDGFTSMWFEKVI